MTASNDGPDAAPLAGISATRYCLFALLAAVAAWAVLFFMPDDPYARYKTLRTTDYIKAGWIYERLHFDPTPVDIAFIGSSRTMQGIDSGAVEAALKAGGQDLHVVNLGLPSLGRDVPYLIGRMALETKHPKILLVEIDYLNYREANPIFSQLAEPRDVLTAPLLINEGLITDLTSVPARHAKLLWRTLTQGAPRFDPATYRGSHWDDTYRTTGHDDRLSPPRIDNMPRAQFDSEAAAWVRNITRKASQYDNGAWLEVHYNESYETRLLEIAKRSGAKVVLFYLAAVGTPPQPYKFATLSQYGELWSIPPELTADNTLWVNPTHMNSRGAAKFSAWVAQRLGMEMPTAQSH